MKLLYKYIVLLSFFACSCQKNDRMVVAPSLDAIIHQYITKNRDASHDHTVQIIFYQVLGEDHLQIYCDDVIDEEHADGGFVCHGDTVIFSYLTELKEKELIDESLIIPKNKLRFKDMTEVIRCEEPSCEDYTIYGKDSIVPTVYPLKTRSDYLATDTVGIHHHALNGALNRFMNEYYWGVLYELVMRKIQDKTIVTIDTSNTYDKRYVKYCFNRNHHLVVVYVLDNIEENIFDKTNVFKDTIPGFRHENRKLWFYPKAECYEMIDDSLDSIGTTLLLEFNYFDYEKGE